MSSGYREHDERTVSLRHERVTARSATTNAGEPK